MVVNELLNIYILLGNQNKAKILEYKNRLRKEDVLIICRNKDLADEVESNIHFLSYDQAADFVENKKFTNLIIVPGDARQDVSLSENIQEVMSDIFQLVKALYVHLLHKNQVRIWFLTQKVESRCGLDCEVANSGIKIIAKTLAVELEKKKVIVNCVECTERFSVTALDYILNYLMQDTLYMQMQVIRI